MSDVPLLPDVLVPINVRLDREEIHKVLADHRCHLVFGVAATIAIEEHLHDLSHMFGGIQFGKLLVTLSSDFPQQGQSQVGSESSRNHVALICPTESIDVTEERHPFAKCLIVHHSANNDLQPQRIHATTTIVQHTGQPVVEITSR